MSDFEYHYWVDEMINEFTGMMAKCARQAIDLIERDGWWTEGNGNGTGRGPNGERCLATAILDSEVGRGRTGGCNVPIQMFDAIERIIISEKWFPTNGEKRLVARWNDAQGRTVEEVLAVLRKIEDDCKAMV